MLVRCGIEHRERFEIERGIHGFSSLFITLRGEYTYSAENITKTVLPYEPIVFKEGSSFVKKVISPIDFIIVTPRYFSHHAGSWLTYEQEDLPRLKSSIDHLKNAIKEDSPEHIKEHFYNDIILTAKASAEKIRHHRAQPAYDYIRDHLGEKFSLSQLSQMNNCSVQTLIGEFKKHYGKTPNRVITDLRIQKAKELLSATDCSISQIAEDCGFDNVYYFSNAFKKETGISPLHFRQNTIL